MNRTILCNELLAGGFRPNNKLCSSGLPVNADNDTVQSKGRGKQVVLAPDCVPGPDAIVWGVEGVVEADHKGQKPGEDAEDLVGNN